MSAPPVCTGLPSGHLHHAAQVLALAFQHDPVACYVLPEATQRHRVLRWMFQAHLRYGERGAAPLSLGLDRCRRLG